MRIPTSPGCLREATRRKGEPAGPNRIPRAPRGQLVELEVREHEWVAVPRDALERIDQMDLPRREGEPLSRSHRVSAQPGLERVAPQGPQGDEGSCVERLHPRGSEPGGPKPLPESARTRSAFRPDKLGARGAGTVHRVSVTVRTSGSARAIRMGPETLIWRNPQRPGVLRRLGSRGK